MLAATLASSILGNMLSSRGVTRASEGVTRARQHF